jgi:hypothetical protein
MAKTHKISTSWDVTGGVLKLEVSAKDAVSEAHIGKFVRSINMAETFGTAYASLNECGQAAIEFGAFTALRNSTGSADTLDEAETAIDRRIEAWAGGEWGAEREQSATPFTANSLLAKAVERATNGQQTAAEAAVKLSALAEAACAANNLGAFAALEPADRNKVRKAITDQIKEQRPLIAASLAQLENERDAAALARKQAAAAKALAAAQGADASGAIL